MDEPAVPAVVPVVVPVAEPVLVPVTEPIMEPVVEPVVEPVAEPVAESVVIQNESENNVVDANDSNVSDSESDNQREKYEYRLVEEPKEDEPKEEDYNQSDDDFVKPIKINEYHPRQIVDPRKRKTQMMRRDFVDNYINSDDDEKEETPEERHIYEKFKNIFQYYRTFSEKPKEHSDFNTILERIRTKIKILQ